MARNCDYAVVQLLDKDIERLNGTITTLENSVNHDISLEKKIIKEKKEIADGIASVKKQNRILTTIRNVKIFLNGLRLVYPYVIVTGFVFGVFALAGDIPFYRQGEKIPMSYEETFDDKGNTRIKGDYESLSKSSYESIEGYISSWEKREDGKYYRTIKKYVVNKDDIDIDALKEAITTSQAEAENILGKQRSVEYEIRKDVTEEELRETTYAKITFKYKDEDDVLVEIQPKGDNFGCSMAYSLICLGISALVLKFHLEASDFSFSSEYNYLKEKYEKVDIDSTIEVFNKLKVRITRLPKKEKTFGIELPNPPKSK